MIVTVKGYKTIYDACCAVVDTYCDYNMLGGYKFKGDNSVPRQNTIEIKLCQVKKRGKYKSCHEHTFKLEYRK